MGAVLRRQVEATVWKASRIRSRSNLAGSSLRFLTPVGQVALIKWRDGGRGMVEWPILDRFPAVPATAYDQQLPDNEGILVNKTELIEHIAKHADISKAAATRALDSMVGAVKTTLRKGGSVSLVGFGTFAVGKRAARSGRNPRTGATIKIKAAKVPKFRPGKALKDALN